MSGFSRIRVFSPTGLLIDEIDAPTVRSWVLNGQGRCQFTMPIYDPISGGLNPKCSLATLKHGNFIVVDHKPSQNADGSFNGLLPPWVGMIFPDQSWDYGKVKITAVSGEQVLAMRVAPLIVIGASGSGNFTALLQGANAFGGVPIQPGIVEGGAQNLTAYPTGNVYDAIQSIAKFSNFDWDVTPQVSASNQLTLLGNWYARKGVLSGQVLSNLNLQSASPMYTEQGKFYNTVIGISDSTSPGVRVKAVVQDQASIDEHGILSTNVVFPGTAGASQDVIQGMASNYLKANSVPQRTFAPVLLDQDNAFSFAVTGNTWIVQNDTVGFFNGGIGISGNIRITAVEYNDLTNMATMAGVLQ